MELTAETIDAKAREYYDAEPLATVEREQQETLPRAFREGAFGRRDAEWVVRWYFRRFLGAFPDRTRRAIEERFAENPFGEVIEAITGAATADPEAAIGMLTELDGVDVPVASAFLAFTEPERYVVVGKREWTVLYERSALDSPYPDPPTVADYERYRAACQAIATETGSDLWAVYRALWRIWKIDHDVR